MRITCTARRSATVMGELNKYKVSWLRRYTEEGTVEVEASSADEAGDIVEKNMGDYEGGMYFDEDGDEITEVRMVFE